MGFPIKVFARSSFLTLASVFCWGSAAACVYARLLKRLSCGTVTVFEPCAKSNFLHFSYGVSAIAGSPPYHSVSTFHAPHTNTLSARPSCQRACLFLHHQKPPALVVLIFRPPSLSRCQSLVQLAEVIPTSSGRSPYPPSALTRGRLAHVVHLRTYGSLHAPTLHYAISQPSWLHFVFPTLAQGCFSFFKGIGLKILSRTSLL